MGHTHKDCILPTGPPPIKDREGLGFMCGSSPSYLGHPVLHMHPSDQKEGLM